MPMQNATPEQCQIAAICYLALFQSGESSMDPKDQAIMELHYRQILKAMDFPTDPIFDNEGEPLVQWPESFDYNQWWENYSDEHWPDFGAPDENPGGGPYEPYLNE